ncbi:mitochondrial carrier homolog 2 [Drosophila grimshawi]|uniref:GH12126 n=1 Tax=Drosophila grimshawi TaxID=7222 RepID=B4JK34_DROGR|nr:mitochondrial carrier homolog 2 [Drosophila grimshawi]EDV99936.1 GH12126 [Drosophila grimshawi]
MQYQRELKLGDIFPSCGGSVDADNQYLQQDQDQAEEQEEQEEKQLLPDGGAVTDQAGCNGIQSVGAVELIINPHIEREELNKPNGLLRFTLRMGFGALMHPYEYAKVLMQLGYEPLPAVASTSWLGRTTLVLPGVHQYMRYIKHTDGFIGLYRGLTPRILASVSSALFADSLVRLLGISDVPQVSQATHPLRDYAGNLMRDGIVIATGLAVSHPFYVIAVRQMAQFVGREIAYTSICGSVREIYAQDGLAGFYAGFAPRLLGDMGVLLCTSTLTAICNRIFWLQPAQREYNAALLQFAAIMLLYPLQVVGACMACSGSGIAAGAPPFMPIYGQWVDCLVDLVARGDHFRGAFTIRRTLPKMHTQIQMPRFYSDPFVVSRNI